jgi:hypothetical protein
MSVARLARLCDGFGKLKSSLPRDHLRPDACDDVTWVTKLASGPSSNRELSKLRDVSSRYLHNTFLSILFVFLSLRRDQLEVLLDWWLVSKDIVKNECGKSSRFER